MTISTVDTLVKEKLKTKQKLTRSIIESHQLQLLGQMMCYVRENRFYREKYLSLFPENFSSLRSFQNLPFLTQDDIIKQGDKILQVSQSEIERIITLQTSGSTGTPKRYYFTSQDLETTSSFFLNGMFSLITRMDKVLVLLPCNTQASVGELLINALSSDDIYAQGLWPPNDNLYISQFITDKKISSVVGLPQHLLGLSYYLQRGQVKSMLLCSDYASPHLRQRIEKNCHCKTFLHYGTTETGLGAAVECKYHTGCHILESDLLVEIIDPETGEVLPDDNIGEIVITTLNRQAQPLLRYRTGDIGSLKRSLCQCGGITARLHNIRGRNIAVELDSKTQLYSQDIDDVIFKIPGIIDYRVIIDNNGVDIFHLHYQVHPSYTERSNHIKTALLNLPILAKKFSQKTVEWGDICKVSSFTPDHTAKRTILDKRSQGVIHA